MYILPLYIRITYSPSQGALRDEAKNSMQKDVSVRPKRLFFSFLYSNLDINVVFQIFLVYTLHLNILPHRSETTMVNLMVHVWDLTYTFLLNSTWYQWEVMLICGWTTLTSQCPLKNDHKRQQICQISHEKCLVVCPVFQVCLFYVS